MQRRLATVILCLTFVSSAHAADAAWTGTWKLDTSRHEPDGAADDYRFRVLPGRRIRWEIPSLDEVNTGSTDGTPMPVRRPGAPPGLTLSVRDQGPHVLRYEVALDGKVRGGGVMTLAPDGRSWTDIPLVEGKPAAGLTMVYVRQ